MPNTKKLLSITNLKKYFPIAKSSLLSREQLYVRANEDITIDIMQGETLGLVGESGCGKSTLGRTILQLYDQTAGTTMYYGRSIDDFAPAYVRETLKNAAKMIAAYKKKEANANALKEECDALGDNATFFQIQNMNLAIAETETAKQNVAKILGGFMALDDPSEGANLLLKKHNISLKMARVRQEISKNFADIDLHKSAIEELLAASIKETMNVNVVKPFFFSKFNKRVKMGYVTVNATV